MYRNRTEPVTDEPEEYLPVEDAASLLGVSTARLIETMNHEGNDQ